MFQSRAHDNKIGWDDAREMLFQLKKTLDQWNRNMLWHFNKSQCEKCTYWNDVYEKHIANVNDSSQEITDDEILQAAMEVDGSNE